MYQSNIASCFYSKMSFILFCPSSQIERVDIQLILRVYSPLLAATVMASLSSFSVSIEEPRYIAFRSSTNETNDKVNHILQGFSVGNSLRAELTH